MASRLDDEYYSLASCRLVSKLDDQCYGYTECRLTPKSDDEDNGLFMDNRLFLAQDYGLAFKLDDEDNGQFLAKESIYIRSQSRQIDTLSANFLNSLNVVGI